jgi:hypothetical protein
MEFFVTPPRFPIPTFESIAMCGSPRTIASMATNAPECLIDVDEGTAVDRKRDTGYKIRLVGRQKKRGVL